MPTDMNLNDSSRGEVLHSRVLLVHGLTRRLAETCAASPLPRALCSTAREAMIVFIKTVARRLRVKPARTRDCGYHMDRLVHRSHSR